MSQTASETENMQVKINSSDKQAKNGKFHLHGLSVACFSLNVIFFLDSHKSILRLMRKYNKSQ